MAKLVEGEYVLSSKDAIAMIKNADGKVAFGVFVRAFLPTEGDRGFEGCAIAPVTRKVMMKVVKDSMRGFEARGAKVKLVVHTSEYGSNIYL